MGAPAFSRRVLLKAHKVKFFHIMLTLSAPCRACCASPAFCSLKVISLDGKNVAVNLPMMVPLRQDAACASRLSNPGRRTGRFNTGGRKSSLWIYAVPTSSTSTRLIINSGTDGQVNLPWRRRLMRALQPRCALAQAPMHTRKSCTHAYTKIAVP